MPSGSTVSSLSSTGGTLEAGNINISVPYVAGPYNAAVWAQSGGSITLTGASKLYSTYGSGGGITGFVADGTGTQILASGLSVNLGSGATVAQAQNGGLITLNEGTNINIGFGGGNVILYATGAGSQILANSISMYGTTGGGGQAVHSALGGDIQINDSTVSLASQGGNEAAMLADGASTITTTNTDVSINASNSYGVQVQGGSTVKMTGGSLAATGSGTVAFQISNGGSNVVTLDGTAVSATAQSFVVSGGATTATISATDSQIIANNGTLLNTTGAPTTTFTADKSGLSGAIMSTGTTNVTLQNGTAWAMTGTSNMTSLVNNDSAIDVAAPTGSPTLSSNYKTLTTGSYTGTGGTLALNTYLGTDNSPSDQLIVTGAASGSTGLIIRNNGGPGQDTTGNGIQVVQTGSSASNTFYLASEARAGDVDYRLYQGGLNGADPSNWFLRSDFSIEPPGSITPPPIVDPGPELPPDPPPIGTNPPAGTYPIIGPEVGAYGVVQPSARQMALDGIGTLHERVGDTLADADATPDAAQRSPAWIRFIGETIDNRYQSFAAPEAKGQMYGAQAGFDFYDGSFIAGHRDTAGAYVDVSHSNLDLEGIVTNMAATGYTVSQVGKVGLDGYFVGGYWTHYGPGGWYVDTVLQGMRFGGNAMTANANLKLNGVGFAPSIEAGYPIALPLGPGFVLEPQVQAVWEYTDFRPGYDGLGSVSLGSTEGTVGRVGVRAVWTLTDDDGRVWQPYGRFNVWHDWNGEATTRFSDDKVPLLDETTEYEMAGGITTKLNTTLSVYGQAGYRFAPGFYRREAVQGSVGIRFTL